MSNLTNDGELLALAAVSSGLTGLEVALFTAAPLENMSNVNSIEVSTSGTGYSRKGVTFDAPSITSNAGIVGRGYSKNSSPVEFDPAQSNWPPVTHLGIYHPDSSKWIWWGALSTPKTVATSDKLVFGPDDIELTMD